MAKYKLSDIYNKEDLAYIAGYIDGEGWIGIAKKKYKNSVNVSYQVVVSIASTDLEPLLLIKGIFGGGISKRTPQWVAKHIPNTKKTTYYHYKVACRKATNLLSAILPYLKMRRRIERAKVAIEMGILITATRNRGGRKPLPQSVIIQRDGVYKLFVNVIN